MERNFDGISMQEAMRLAKTDTGRQLYDILRSQKGDALDQAMADAAAGDYTKVKESISAMLTSPQVKALMEQLRGNSDG